MGIIYKSHLVIKTEEKYRSFYPIFSWIKLTNKLLIIIVSLNHANLLYSVEKHVSHYVLQKLNARLNKNAEVCSPKTMAEDMEFI